MNAPADDPVKQLIMTRLNIPDPEAWNGVTGPKMLHMLRKAVKVETDDIRRLFHLSYPDAVSLELNGDLEHAGKVLEVITPLLARTDKDLPPYVAPLAAGSRTFRIRALRELHVIGDTSHKHLATILRESREARGLTPERVAHELHMPVTLIVPYEVNENTAYINRLVKLIKPQIREEGKQASKVQATRLQAERIQYQRGPYYNRRVDR